MRLWYFEGKMACIEIWYQTMRHQQYRQNMAYLLCATQLLAKGWKHGVKSCWETEPDDPRDIPFAIKRLRAPGKKREIQMQLRDLSGMGHGTDVERSSTDEVEEERLVENEEQLNAIKENGKIPIRSLSLEYFRKKLITHFNIAYKKKEVQWPRRLKKDEDDK